MHNGRIIAATALVVSSFLTLSALAAPPHLPDMVTGGNKWQLTGFDDSSTTHPQGAVQTLCFFNNGVVGTHQRYRWASITFGGWDGLATQEGDQVFLHGDFTFILMPNAGHDSIDFELTTRNEGMGHWKEWIENDANGLTLVWNNARLTRTGTCLQKTAAEVIEFARTQPNSLDAAGVPITTPSGVDPNKAAVEAAELEVK